MGGAIVLGRFFAAFRTWDRLSQIAFLIALILLLAAFGVLVFGPEITRQPAIIGTAGLLLAMQAIVLWGNRSMVTPFTQAQRQYLSGDLESARQILEKATAEGKPNVKALTLLGNTYRQLGRLDESEARLRQALEQSHDETFPLIGLGRTLLAQGRYSEAAKTFRAALTNGAPPLIQLDLGEALYHQGAHDEAKTALLAAKPTLTEPYQILMADYLLHTLQAGPPPSPETLETGLLYWQASAERFAQTDYGQKIGAMVETLEKEIKEKT
jgi:tetratricopeptide (TPR) repeat protein